MRNRRGALLITTSLLALFALGFGLKLGAESLLDLWFAHQSTSWPSTDGTILTSRAEKVLSGSTSRQSYWTKDLRYRYAVAGKTYESTRYNAGDVMSDGEYRDLEIAFPAGSSTRVFYDPQSPARAVLVPGISGGHWSGLAVPPLLLIFGAFSAFMFIQVRRGKV